MLVPGFAPAGASMPHAMDGLFPELMANAANQGRATPPGGAGAIFFNPLAHVSPAAETPPAAGAAKQTYISGYVLERRTPVPFPPGQRDASFFRRLTRVRTLSLPSTQAQDREQRGDAYIHSVFHRAHPVSLRVRSFVQARDAEGDSRAQGAHGGASLRV